MPPVNQQGSKAGLITALVIAVILLMVSVIVTITTTTELTKTKNDAATVKRQYEKVARNDQLAAESGDVALIDAAKEKLAGSLQGSSSTIDVAIEEIKKLTQDISGIAVASYSDADAKSVEVVNKALGVLKDPGAPIAAATTAPAVAAGAMPANESLFSVIQKLEEKLGETAKSDKARQAQLKELSTSLETRVAAWNAQAEELSKKVADAEKRAATAMAGLDEAQKQYMAKQTTADQSNQTVKDSSGAEVTAAQTSVAQARAEVAKLMAQNTSLLAQIAKYRMDVKDSAVRQADGAIIRVPSTTVCYINLGSGDHLPAGTTFEVYDKAEGVPGLGKDGLGENNMPIGKASIEVVRVGQNSSECRIVHLQPGATLAEGDIIANLVYDRNTTFNFFVYGNFDVDGNGIWTAQEADVVKSLVTRWGAKVVDKIAVNTDFAVLGQEPVVPVFTKEDLQDPVNVDKLNRALASLKAYQDIVNQAATLHIPVMNQNRFMYYIGYYDQMKR
jgi:hypothetical protein